MLLSFPSNIDAAVAAGELQMTIDGEPVGAAPALVVINPATGEPAGRAPDAGTADLDRAVAAARAALPRWSGMTHAARAERLGAFADAIQRRAHDVAAVLTLEQGKELASATFEIFGTVAWMKQFSTIEIPEAVIRPVGRDGLVVRHRPVGVVGAIAPWNVPVFLGFMKVAQALIAGCTIVLKPSPFTPLSTLLVGALSRGILPPGVLNVVSGGDALGQAMTDHEGIDKISFTGSTETGKRVVESASRTMKRVTLELGGNDPAIILPDADLDRIVPALMIGAFGNAGQVCMAIKRLFVHEDIHDEVAARLAVLARDHVVGSGFEPGTAMGPIQNRAQFDRVIELVEDAGRMPGAQILAGGKPLDGPGFFYPPTLVVGLDDDARLVREEQFGPALPILSWRTEDEVIARANATRFGLSASIWTRDLEKAQDMSKRLDVGTVWINAHGLPDPAAPFGGTKESGLGRSFGPMGVEAYMEAQTLSIEPSLPM